MRRETVEVKSGRRRSEIAYGVTSLTSGAASPQRLLALNRGHWTIEATHHILDWSFDEDRSRIRAGHGPENMTLLRRFAIGLIKGRRLAVAEVSAHARMTPPPTLRLSRLPVGQNDSGQIQRPPTTKTTTQARRPSSNAPGRQRKSERIGRALPGLA